jgi:hypothetical protein
MPRFLNRRVIGVAVAVLASAVTLAAQQAWWTTIAATGIPNSASAWMVQYNYAPSMSIKSSVSSGVALIKYNVTATEELTRVGPSESSPLCFTAAIRADTAASRVRVTLYRVQGATPQALGTLDSDAAPANGVTGYREIRSCDLPGPSVGPNATVSTLDFYDNAYYVEVELTKRDSTGNPGVMRIGLGHEIS